MSSKKIELLKMQRKKEIIKKKNQIPYAILGSLTALLIYFNFLHHPLNLSTFWIIGILIGIIMQRSRFCFTAGFRDPIMVGSTTVLKAIILAFMISTVGFFIIQYKFVITNPSYTLSEIPGQLCPVGIHTAMGAILFGIGMVIAGGCASGTLVRMGEGYGMQWIVLLGFIIGTTMGARHFPFWNTILIAKTPIVYIPHHLGFFPSLILQLILLVVLYYIADWYDKKNSMMINV